MVRGAPQGTPRLFYMQKRIKQIIASLLLLFCICNLIPSALAASITIPFSLDGVSAGSYDNIITDSVTTTGSKKLSISKTYLKIVDPGDEIILENKIGEPVGKGYYALTRQATKAEKWVGSTTKKVSDLPADFKVTAEALQQHGFSEESISTTAI